MAQLTAAIGPNDTRIHLDQPLPAGTYFRIDDELIAVTARSARTGLIVTGLIVSIKRGMQGTTPAAHEVGAEVDLYVDAYTTPTPFSVGGEVTIRQASVTLTDAQIKALSSTYVEIVPAPGNGNIIVMLAAIIVLDTTAGGYTGADADCEMHLVWGDDDNTASEITSAAQTDDALAGTAISRWLLGPDMSEASPGVWQAKDVWISAGKPLKIVFYNNSALGGGNVANSMKVTVWYGIFEA